MYQPLLLLSIFSLPLLAQGENIKKGNMEMKITFVISRQVAVQTAYHSQGRRCSVTTRARSRPAA